MTLELETALAIVRAAGFRITKPKIKNSPSLLNAIGKPYGASYDPNYKMKYRPRKYAPANPPLDRRCLTV